MAKGACIEVVRSQNLIIAADQNGGVVEAIEQARAVVEMLVGTDDLHDFANNDMGVCRNCQEYQPTC